MRNRIIEIQINYINRTLLDVYDVDLQVHYLDEKVFSNARFALYVIEYSNKTKNNKREYSRILDQRVKPLLSGLATIYFAQDMVPRLGVFYNGRVNLVLKQYKKVVYLIFRVFRLG